MERLTTNNLPQSRQTSHLKFNFNGFSIKTELPVLFICVLMGLSTFSKVQAQEIVSKPDSLKVYTHSQTIAIEARREIDYLELWDVAKSKRRLKFKPRNHSIRVNTQRLRKSDYQIVLFFGNDTKLIKFTK